MKLVAIIANLLCHNDPAPVEVNPSLPPVLLVHGIHCDALYMARLERFLRASGRRVVTPSLKPCHGSARLEELAAQLKEVADRELPGQRFDIVSHSMGGLISRYYVQKLGGDARARRLITMATPNHGTILARLHPGQGARQMQPGSAFLEALNADDEVWQRVPLINFYTPCDLVIIPFTSSRMKAGRNIRTWALTHPSYMLSMKQFRALRRVLDEG